MKQLFKTIAVAFACVAAAACAKQEITSPADQVVADNLVKVTISADIAQTKASVESDGKVIWNEGDQIAVYVGGQKYPLTLVAGAGTKSAVFSGEVAEGEVTDAIYPASAAPATFTTEHPAPTALLTQTIISGATCDPAALLMTAVPVEGSLVFENACGGVRVTVPAGAISVTLKSAVSTVKATVPGAGTYDIFVPVSEHEGFTVSAAVEDGRYVLTSDKTMAITAGKIWNLNDICTSALFLPATITTAEQLRNWAANSGLYDAGEIVSLGADIDLGGTEWVPAVTFAGVFDGADHKISGLVCTSYQDNNTGLISTLGKGATLKNLVAGSSDGSSYDGVSKLILDIRKDAALAYKYVGVVGYAHEGSLIQNVTNYIPVEIAATHRTQHRAGGIAGTMKARAVVKDCVNYGTVTDNCVEENFGTNTQTNTLSFGGITGGLDGAGSLVDNCINHGDVQNNSIYVQHTGGVAGMIGYEATISNCVNNGAVTDNAVLYNPKSSTGYAKRAGGITGAIQGNNGGQIIKCTNNGAVTLVKAQSGYSSAIGGIVGCVAKNGTIKGVNNSGKVTTVDVMQTGLCMGGIVGYVTGSVLITLTQAEDGTRNVNTGEIIPGNDLAKGGYIGGIYGYLNTTLASGCVVENCDNEGNIKSSGKQTSKVTITLGGILGAGKNMVVSDCHNKALINCTGKDNNAGFVIAGILGGGANPYTIHDCSNSGRIQIGKGKESTTIAGGIAANFKLENCNITDCVNTGEMYASRGAKVRVGSMIGACTRDTSTPVTILEGCVCDNDMFANPTGWAAYEGLVVGSFITSEEAATAMIYVGSEAKPVKIGLGHVIKSSDETVEIITLTADNYKDYLVGQAEDSGRGDSNIVFNTVAL